MANNIQNNTQNYGRNVNLVASDVVRPSLSSSSGGYLKKNELLSSIERVISNTSTTPNEIIGDYEAQTNRSDLMFKGSVTTATSIQSIKNYTKESQKLKPFFSDEILEWSEVVLVLFLILLIVITVIGKWNLIFSLIIFMQRIEMIRRLMALLVDLSITLHTILTYWSNGSQTTDKRLSFLCFYVKEQVRST